MKEKSIVWTLERARELVAKLWPLLEASGWYCGITGSVLVTGESRKDLDLIVYPAQVSPKHPLRMADLRRALRAVGMRPFATRDRVVSQWRALGSADEKWVEVWMAGGRRVDVFVLK